ncbi:hypothetical protein QT881_00080 [Xanthomonas fragariae]|uniref:hypothetical protein n=1 Tax=Xanthomonas fragariae TaxID=48664 RepID=UPI000D54EA69|nr:hypothetical protein [Xanthomonas fragariae]MDM7553361.1 hypothetical protein [Xanthomonas fragariae]MDM7556456.1 hypothetical protein [Xanthomonas fragariae]MDM7574143.1 hypothetical protein [Xanthomonas fragariae]MDM7587388.1 hypothetical protein [Xanthomonas fragariae]
MSPSRVRTMVLRIVSSLRMHATSATLLSLSLSLSRQTLRVPLSRVSGVTPTNAAMRLRSSWPAPEDWQAGSARSPRRRR